MTRTGVSSLSDLRQRRSEQMFSARRYVSAAAVRFSVLVGLARTRTRGRLRGIWRGCRRSGVALLEDEDVEIQ